MYSQPVSTGFPMIWLQPACRRGSSREEKDVETPSTRSVRVRSPRPKPWPVTHHRRPGGKLVTPPLPRIRPDALNPADGAAIVVRCRRLPPPGGRPWRPSPTPLARPPWRFLRGRMTQPIAFTKLSGSGNDFICIDNRAGELNDVLAAPAQIGALARALCRRSLGVGADGLILACIPEVEGHGAQRPLRGRRLDGPLNGRRVRPVETLHVNRHHQGVAPRFGADQGQIVRHGRPPQTPLNHKPSRRSDQRPPARQDPQTGQCSRAGLSSRAPDARPGARSRGRLRNTAGTIVPRSAPKRARRSSR